jgi:hypothetical protein
MTAEQQVLAASERRYPCPFCAEPIVAAARVCRFCARELPQNWAAVATQASDVLTLTRPLAQLEPAPKIRNTPIFLVLASIALVLSLYTPRLLLFFPIMGTLGCGAISLLRNEKGRIGAVLVLVFGLGLLVLSEMGTVAPQGGVKSSGLDAAEIVAWNWRTDPNFGTHGTIKWNVQVHNKSSENIGTVRVEFTTYDNAGKLVSSTFTYINAIPPGQTRSNESFADLYTTEDRAMVQITDVRFAR